MRRWALAMAVAALVPAAVQAGPREDVVEEAWIVIEKGTRSGDMLARARALETMGKVPGKDVSSWLKEGVQDPQWGVRKATFKALAAKGDPQGKAGLLAALRDPSLPVEDDAFDLVSVLGAGEATAALVDAALDPKNPQRQKIFKAAVARGANAALPLLSAGLARGDAVALAALKDVRSTDRAAVAAALAKDRSPVTVAAALEWALAADVPVPVATLKPLLKGKDEATRFLAAELLARGGDGAAVATLLPLADRDAASQLRFLKAAAAAPSTDVLPRLKKYLAPETPEAMLQWVYLAFAGSSDADVRTRVEGDLNSTLPARRAAAVRAIGRLLGTRALPKLHGLLGDGNPAIRRLAAEALGELAQAESVEHLERAVRDVDRDARLAVVTALSKIRDKSVVPVASYLIYDRDLEIRKLAILAICNANHDSAMPVLRISLEDRDPAVRGAVLLAIARQDMNAAMEVFPSILPGLTADTILALVDAFKAPSLPFLRMAANSDRAWARAVALRAVRALPDQEIAFLGGVVGQSAFGDARQAAMERLSELSCPDALKEAETRLQHDPVPEVRITALQVTAACGADESLAWVKVGLLDPEENVRVAAAAAMLSYPKGKGGKPAAAPGKAKAKVKAKK